MFNPNFYGQSYTNPYYQPMYNQTQYPTPYQVQQSNQTNYINGKIVDVVDVAKAAEVPMGSYGVFPKADLSEVYIKAWNADGSTKLIIYKPVIPERDQQRDIERNTLQSLSTQMTELQTKVDKILTDLCT